MKYEETGNDANDHFWKCTSPRWLVLVCICVEMCYLRMAQLWLNNEKRNDEYYQDHLCSLSGRS